MLNIGAIKINIFISALVNVKLLHENKVIRLGKIVHKYSTKVLKIIN